MEPYYDGTEVAVCFTAADTFWSSFYFIIICTTLFFLLPFVILVLLYAAIAYKLLHKSEFHRTKKQTPVPSSTKANAPGIASITTTQYSHSGTKHTSCGGAIGKHRKQVIFMLVAVVASFFICLLPFRAFTLWIIVSNIEDLAALGLEGYYNILYMCRIMLYLNSALNPVLYNLMSSKFRNGFWRLLISLCDNTEHRVRCTRSTTKFRSRYAIASQKQVKCQDESASNSAEVANESLKDTKNSLKRDAFVVHSISTSSSTERTSSSWRSGSLSTSLSIGGFVGANETPLEEDEEDEEKYNTAVGAAIINITNSAAAAACLYEHSPNASISIKL